jgi:hypothetical protein
MEQSAEQKPAQTSNNSAAEAKQTPEIESRSISATSQGLTESWQRAIRENLI